MLIFKQITMIVSCIILVTSFALAAGDAARGEMLFNDPTLGGSNNAKSCASCHLKGSGLKGIAAKLKKSGQSLDERVNICVTGPLGGKALPKDSEEMQDIISYIESLDDK